MFSISIEEMPMSQRPVNVAYARAERFLLDLVNYEVQPPPMRSDEEGWHLREFARLLARLGDPQEACPIVHVAGTKGKSSTTRLLSSLLRAQGWRRVGSFTSPHLSSFRERIAIDLRPISKSAFVEALRAVRGAHPRLRAEGFRTTFEMLTAMAFWTFRRRRCEAVVLETGLGGRLDSTNVAPSWVALITAIGYDHQRVLGQTIEAIAREKAGIVKPGAGIVVLGPQTPRYRKTVAECVRKQTRKAGVAMEAYNALSDPIVAARPDAEGFRIDLAWRGGRIDGVRLNALGRHQIDNLRSALMVLDAFSYLGGREIRPAGVRKGIEAFRSPGRMEIVRRDPLVIADSAHCGLSARAAAAALCDHFPGRPTVLVLGVLGDKNRRAIVEGFSRAGNVRRVFVYAPDTPRACPAARLAGVAAECFRHVRAFPDEAAAVRAALDYQTRHPKTIVLISGSTYGVAPASRLVRGASGAD